MKNTTRSPKNITRLMRLVLASLITLLQLPALHAANYYWVGGSGNWSDYASHWATTSGGNIFHTAIPSLNDDVYFDNNSFTAAGQSVTLDNTLIYCKSMDWTGAQFSPTLYGNPNQLNVYGSLNLIAAMSFDARRVNFRATGAGNTITSAGQTLDTLYFEGAGTYSLADPLTVVALNAQNGTFNSSGFTINAQQFIIGITGNSVTVDLGTSAVNISNIFKAFDGTIVMNSSQCDLTFTSGAPFTKYLWSLGNTFHDVHFQSNGEVIGFINCNNLTADGSFYINGSWGSVACNNAIFNGGTTLDCDFSAASVTLTVPGVYFKIRELNITGTFTMDGVCGAPVYFQPIDFLNSGTLNVATGAVTVSWCNITSIQASGGASFIANNSVDGGSNTGWTINAAAARTLYWVGDSGNWEDQSHWALSSGGAGGNCIPSLVDNVIFDANSFTQANQTVTLTNSTAVCNNMDWTAAGFSPEFAGTFGSSTLKLHGSLTLNPSMTWSIYEIQFAGTSMTSTLFSAGITLLSVNFNSTGLVTLADPLNCDALYGYSGSFSSGNYDIHAKTLFANAGFNNISFDFGTSTVYLSEVHNLFGNLLTINSANANLVIEASGATPFEMQGNPVQYNVVTCYADAYINKLTCNYFDAYDGLTVTDLDADVADFRASFLAYKLTTDTLRFTNGVSQFWFDTLNINGTWTIQSSCSNTLSLDKANPFNPDAILTKTSGTLQLDYVVIRNIHATGGATFIANNSADMGNNPGWTFNAAPSRDLYWVGGTGNWNDTGHWALSSGGAPGECQPAKQDNVFFDANSFSQSGDTVYVSPNLGVYCNNMNIAGIPSATVLKSNTGNTGIKVYGSVSMPAELDPYDILLEMMSNNTGNTISTGGNNLTGISFVGSGEWSLLGPLDIFHFSGGSGVVNTGNFAINSGDINLGGNITINAGSSVITALGFYVSNASVVLNTSDADLIITSPVLSLQMNGYDFHAITFTDNANTQGNFSCDYLTAMGEFRNINSSITTGYAKFSDNVKLEYAFVCDTVEFDNPGKLVEFENFTVNNEMICNGNSGFPIQLEGFNGGGTLTKSSGQLCIDYVLLRNVTATGGALFFAGNNSVDLGGNSGWAFVSCVTATSVVWPGDANYDLVADNNDILNIGLAYGYTGPVRAAASLTWVAQPAADWSFQFANGANLKHADTDGNGVVDVDDTTAVSLNYGLTHPFRLMPPSVTSLPSPQLYVITNPDTANLSDTVNVEVFLGTGTTQVDSIYGIAFTLNYDTALVSDSYFNADFNGCWMGTPGVDLITFSHNRYSDGAMDFAIVRTDQNNTNGFGFLNRLGIVIVDNVGAKVTLPLTISNVTAITASEYVLSLLVSNDSVLIDTTGTVGINELMPLADQFSLYPNPAGNFIQLSAPLYETFEMEVFNQFGRSMLPKQMVSNGVRMNTTSLSQGVYYMTLTGSKGKITRKFNVIRN